MKPSEAGHLTKHLPYTALPRWRPQSALAWLFGFAIIPAIFLFVAVQLTNVSGPQWLGSNFENSYVYLFNSLLIVKGEAPAHIDHPGTTTQVFGAAVLRACGNTSGDQLIEAVLDDPEKFLKYVHMALLIVCALALWISPLLTALRVGSWIIGVLLQLPILFFNTIWHYSIWFGSDLTLIAFSIVAVSLCVLLLGQWEAQIQKLPIAALAGVACGLGIATKLTFFPLILTTLVCCKSRETFLVFSASFLVVVALALYPIYPKLSIVFQWTLSLLIHSGRYGSGSVGFATDHYTADVATLLSGEPFVLLIPLFANGIILLLVIQTGWKSLDPSVRRLAFTACMVFVMQTVSFIVMARESLPHYLIPLYVSTGLNLVFLWQLVWRHGRPIGARLIDARLAILLIVFGLSNLAFRTPGLYQSLRSACLSELAFYSRVKEETKNALRVDYYRSISPEFAVWFANGYSSRAFAGILEKKFPNALFYNIFSGNFEIFGSVIKQEDVFKKSNQLFFFGSRAHAGYARSLEGLKSRNLKKVDQEREYVVDEWIAE
jgi:hypothetical protein